MMRRIPLWLTLLPLLVGVAIYAWLWRGWAADFKAAIQPWLPGAELSIAGFPYRLEAAVERPALRGGDVVQLAASAARAQINRGPWQPDLTIVSTTAPRFSAIVGPGIGASLSGLSGLSSIHVVDGRVVRFSTVVEAARARLGFTSALIAADVLQLHLRELPPGEAAAAGPTSPPRGQLVIAGERLRFDKGDALTLAADIAVTSAARLVAYDAWASAGTIEVPRLTIADAHGEIARVNASIVPLGRRGLRFAGTIETICPATIAAAFAARPAAPELRLRAPVRLAFEGSAGAVQLTGVPVDLATRAVRAQVPACPVVRGRG